MQGFKAVLESYVIRLGQRVEEQRITYSRTKEIILFLAVILLIAGVYASISSHPQLLDEVNWSMILAIVVVGVPATILLNSVEFIVIGSMVGCTITSRKALEIAVIGTAANIMPLPGSTIVRVAALKLSGAGYKMSTIITLLTSAVWIGAAFFYSGLMLLIFAESAIGAGLAATGFTLLVAATGLLLYFGIAMSQCLYLLIVKFCLVLLDAVRIYWCFIALDVELELWQASVFVISSVLASAAPIVPGGIGLRELLSSGLAPIVGLSPAAGFLTATLNRILGLSVLLPATGALILYGKRRTRR